MKEQDCRVTSFIPLEQIGTDEEKVMIPGTGVVLGKFYPPHRGHKFLIDTAQANCNALTVVVCERTEETIPGEQRREWTQKIHPEAFVRKLNCDGLPNNDSPLWARLTVGLLHYIPEFAFSSESYGEPWAEAMGNTHVLVDHSRMQVPISGTLVRENPDAAREFLEPCVWEYFEKQIMQETQAL